MLASSTMMLMGVPLTRVLRRIRETREHRYELFRGFFRGITDAADSDDLALQQRLHSVLVTAGAKAIGRQLLELELGQVEVTAVRRRHVRTTTPAPEMRIEVGDVVVLLGSESAVAAAEMKLLQG
jgi:CPA2 family monovalent cation:H+ antiporter-2